MIITWLWVDKICACATRSKNIPPKDHSEALERNSYRSITKILAMQSYGDVLVNLVLRFEIGFRKYSSVVDVVSKIFSNSKNS